MIRLNRYILNLYGVLEAVGRLQGCTSLSGGGGVGKRAQAACNAGSVLGPLTLGSTPSFYVIIVSTIVTLIKKYLRCLSDLSKQKTPLRARRLRD